MENLYHIGRDKANNEIYIIDESVSSSHAQILIDENADLIIIDLSSKNGVFVNSIKIESPIKLENGDVIKLGNFSFTKQDLLNAIKVFESNKREGNASNISLISSIQRVSKEISSKNKINIKRSTVIMLIIIGMTIIAFGVNYLIKQNTIKEKLQDDKFENHKDSIEGNDNKEESSNSQNKTPNKTQQNTIKQSTDITYDFSCLSTKNDGGSNDIILEFGELTRDVQSTILKDIEISIKDEKQAGNNYVNELLREKKSITKGKDYLRLNRIMKDLISRLAEPRGVKYEMFFIDDTIENVFTLGGNIIFYKGMYDLCLSDSEIASLISHEIAHNELGHSTLALKKQKVANDFGIFGEIALAFESIASTSFNQKQETEADMFGMDLIYPTDYHNCASVAFWKRISEDENDFNISENLFRSHPYSKNRANCLRNHLNNNYNINCN
jgi:beta-barrel assembly-enhancing protease